MEKTNKDRINKKIKEPHHDCQCPGKDMAKEEEDRYFAFFDLQIEECYLLVYVILCYSV